MAAIVSEKPESRRCGDDFAEIGYTVRNEADGSAARAAVLAAAPATYDGKALDDVQVDPVFVDSTNAAACIWDAVARYALADAVPLAAGESSFIFETSGGTQHITQSRSTISRTPAPGGTAPDFKGAIGVSSDGKSVEGVDIVVPVYEFAETHIKTDASVTAAYKAILFGLTGRTNDATFKGLAAGECLFLGASGSKRGDGNWEISFRFAGSPSVTNEPVGDITVPAKKGWEYLWVLYEPAPDDTAKAVVAKPKAAYVERVYRSGDFSTLGIGT